MEIWGRDTSTLYEQRKSILIRVIIIVAVH